MGRLVKYIMFAAAFAIALFSASNVNAQAPGVTPTPSPTQISPTTGQSPLPTPRTTLTATTVATDTSAATADVLPTITQMLTNTGTISATAPITQDQTSAEPSTPLQGTIISNRSETAVRYFLEGATYELAAGRSQGIELPRATTVINLFNCPATLADDAVGCFWDPYLLQQDGFYEIYEAPDSTTQVRLMLREAGAPPTGQVWVQNRTGQTESLVFRDEVFEILPTAVLEFPVSNDVPAILYVRSCMTIDGQSACEWAPKTLAAGVYYAMVESDTSETATGSLLTTIDLRPIVGEGEVDTMVEAPTAASSSILCSVVVPALNVRSGPGLQYDIIDKVRSEGEPATVSVTGRSDDSQWLTVEPSVAANGWINNSPSFISCSGDPVSLPVVAAPPAPTPQPVIVQEQPVPDTTSPTQPDAAPSEDTAAPAVPEETPTAATIPDGQSVLVVNNGFQHEMRFTIDQVFRPIDGPSEYDLAPGGSVSIVVYPGDVAFSASTPWSGLSSNATVHIDANQSLPLWLRFEPDTDGSWVFRWN